MSAPAIPPVAGDAPRPLVSVVTAAFNARAGVIETAASVAAQDFPDREHVVIDGGSRDGTADWLEAQGDAIRWISEPDDGIADAMNKGVAMARGEWILVLHAEDTFLSPDALAGIAPLLSDAAAAGEEILSCDVVFAAADGDRLLRSGGFGPRMNFKAAVPHQGAFCRRAIFERLGGFDPTFRIAMDFDFFLRAKRAGVRLRTAGAPRTRMPDTGVSSRLDWPSLARRFAEERRVQRRHCPGPGTAALNAALWPPYLLYRRLRAAMQGGAR